MQQIQKPSNFDPTFKKKKLTFTSEEINSDHTNLLSTLGTLDLKNGNINWKLLL